MLKIAQAAFAVAYQISMNALWFYKINLSPLDKYKANFTPPHDWLMSLPIDLAALCENRTADAIWLFSGLMYNLCLPLCGYSPLPPFIPIARSAYGIGYTSENHLKWLAIHQLSIQQM